MAVLKANEGKKGRKVIAAKRSVKKKAAPPLEVAYAVSLITQGQWRFYTLTMPSDVLAKCCYVSDRYKDPAEGFQRRLDKRRAQEIADYIDSGLGTIPSAVILSAQEAADFQLTGRSKTVRFKVQPQSFFVLDGQHRIYGYSLAKTQLRVPVVIYEKLTKEQEVKLFIDINTKQRPVSNELLLDIKRLASYESNDEKLLGQLFDEFNRNPESVLLGWLSSSEKMKGKISRVTFNAAIRPSLDRFSNKEIDSIFATLNSYLAAVRQHLADKRVGDSLGQPTVFRALLDIFPRVARTVIDRNGEGFEVADFFDALEPIFRHARRATFEAPGGSYRELSKKFVDKLDQEPLL
jgi:DGQHR domain-containing protein